MIIGSIQGLHGKIWYCTDILSTFFSGHVRPILWNECSQSESVFKAKVTVTSVWNTGETGDFYAQFNKGPLRFLKASLTISIEGNCNQPWTALMSWIALICI